MRKDRLSERREQAIERQEQYNKLSIVKKIELAKSRRGCSVKEIVKLQIALDKAKTKEK